MQTLSECPVNSVVKVNGKLWAVVEFVNCEYHLQCEQENLYLTPFTKVELIATPAALALWFAGVKAGAQ